MNTPSSPLARPVHVSLGSYGRTSHLLAIADMIAHPPSEPLLGTLSTDRVQICPQNLGLFDADIAREVKRLLPRIEWRLHANVRVDPVYRWADIADWPQQQNYFAALARVSQVLAAPAYSAHAGRRDRATVDTVLNNARELEHLFGVPVAIEGHYPTPGDIWLFSTWAEYRRLLNSNVHYALDLSHLHIVASRTGVTELGLVRELLACERCIEVHLSHNDGRADQHRPLLEAPWWFSLLGSVNPAATFFSEGRQRLREPQAVAA
ncbi:MAG: hypothetical protein ACOY9J_13150 [Pseudomonadota bacterium]